MQPPFWRACEVATFPAPPQSVSVMLGQASAEHFPYALNFCRSAIAALVRSPCPYWPLPSPEGAPLPLAPPCNRQRPFFVAGDRQGLGKLTPALGLSPNAAVAMFGSSPSSPPTRR
jgi:hypothetical protein